MEAEPATRAQLRAGFAFANDLGLDRDDRMALAEVVCGHEVSTWNHLTRDEMRQVLKAMDSYVYVRHLRIEWRR